MEKVNVVIEIPEEEYRIILLSDKTAMSEFASKEAMMYAIKNGTPLPKGHGDLIDRNELAVDYTSSDWNDYVSVEQIKNAKAIVEADKEGAEE
jgi:hypothetical protein